MFLTTYVCASQVGGKSIGGRLLLKTTCNLERLKEEGAHHLLQRSKANDDSHVLEVQHTQTLLVGGVK